MTAFGPLATCNLCTAEGGRFVIPADEDTWFQRMDDHTRQAHPDHIALLARGETYVPAIPSPMGGD